MKVSLYVRKLSVFVAILLATIAYTKAEVTLSYPLENSVIQRDNSNQGVIYIVGNITDIVDRIEARFIPVQAGWGTQSDWFTVENNPQGGYFYGSRQWSGGWYTLEVRGIRNNHEVTNSRINRVGIGEVFLIAGQSNAQGHFGKSAPSSGDERVVRVNHNGIDGPDAPYPYPSYERISGEDVIAPRGKSAWAWGRLGDLIAQRLNVPVLFYNVAWDSSSIKNWLESIDKTTYSHYDPTIPFLPEKMPFGNFRNVVHTYIPMSGLRAILWTQGETDNDFKTAQATYKNQLQTFIQTTSSLFNINFNWVISRTSYTGRSGTNTSIINAQNQVINALSNAYEGPNTDIIQIPRPDNYHFEGGGISQLADAWNSSLNANFFSNANPQLGEAPIRFRISCSENNYLSVVPESDLKQYEWSNGGNTKSISIGEGNIQLKGRDAANKMRYAPVIKVPSNFRAQKPLISFDGRPQICQNGEIDLHSNLSDNITWNTGANSETIKIRDGGNYTVKTRNAWGCEATSDVVTINKINAPLPKAPVVSASATTTFCEGGNVNLSSSTSENTFWSNGVRGSNLSVSHSGEFYARTEDSNGCFSLASNHVRVNVNPLPNKPTIIPTSATTFCQGQNVNLVSSEGNGITWSNGHNSKQITVQETGTYHVVVRDGNGCTNTSDQISVKVNSLPSAPILTALNPTTICQNEQTTLQANEQHRYRWNNGFDGRQLTLNTAGNYSLVAIDHNGCESALSNVVTVNVNPIPQKPSIVANGSTTFCASESVQLVGPEAPSYIWSNGGNSREISANLSGAYSLKIGNNFGCYSNSSDAIQINTLEVPPTPSIHIQGKTEVCEGEEVFLTAQGNAPYYWSNNSEESRIQIIESGEYSVRTKGQNGCYSFYSQPVSIEVHQTPLQPIIEQVGPYTLDIKNAEPNQYIWQLNAQTLEEEDKPAIKVTRNGDYTVKSFLTYSPTLTCYSIESEKFTYLLNESHSRFLIYPNPVSERFFYIETRPDIARAIVELYTLDGRMLLKLTEVDLTHRQKVIIPELPEGLYVVRVHSRNFSLSERIIVTH